MKLLGISLGTVLVAALLWTTLWFWGQSLTYKPYDHPLVSWTTSDGNPRLALQTHDLAEAKTFLEKNSDGILVLNLHVSSEGQFFTAKPEELGFVTKLPETNLEAYKGNKSFYYDLAFLKSQAPSLIPAEEWLQLKPAFWILNIEDNATNVDANLVAWIEKNKLENHAIITSDIDLVISATKDKRPLWIYGSSQSDLTKLLSMASVNLEALVNFKRDYFITPVAWNHRNMLNPKVIAEMKRRFKKVAIGPVHTDQDRAEALALKPDVLILSSH